MLQGIGASQGYGIGKAAADLNMIPKLIEWGLDEFSVTPTSILQTGKAICACE